MPDIIDQIYPWRHFTVETWKSGHLPLWNPNSFSGNPHLANFQSAVFSPFNLLFFIFSFIDAWSIMVLLQPLLAGIFMYAFLRELTLTKYGSLMGSVAFMFCGFIVVWMAYGTLSMAIAFLPFILLCIEKNFIKPQLKWLIFLSISIPLSFFSGHFQTSLYALLLSGSFLIYRAILVKDVRRIFPIALFFIFGIFISLIQIIPSIQFYLYSVRSGLFIKEGGIPIKYLITLFAPDFFGNPVTRNDWFGYYAEWASFIGIIPLFLAIISLTSPKKKILLFFFVAGIFVLLFAVQSPLLGVLGNLKIPVLSTSTPSRIIVLFSFSFSVLSAFGLDALLETSKNNIRNIKIIHIFFTLIFIFIWLQLFVFRSLPYDKFIIARNNLILPTLLFLILTITIFVINKFKNKHAYIFFVILILLASFDSFRFSQKWMPFDPKDLVFPNLSVIDAMKKEVGYGRVFGNLGGHIDTYYDIPSVEGYDPLYIERYGDFIRTANTGSIEKAARSVAVLDRNGKYIDRVLDFLGVNIIFHPTADSYQGWAYNVWDKPQKFSVVFQDEKFQLLKNKTAMNRVALFYDYVVINNKDEVLKTFYTKDFDFRKKIILEENPKIEKSVQVNEANAEITFYSPNKITIKTHSPSVGLLLLTDNYYPGWRAKVNGIITKVFRADYTFRAIVVPLGNSIVEFEYSAF